MNYDKICQEKINTTWNTNKTSSHKQNPQALVESFESKYSSDTEMRQ